MNDLVNRMIRAAKLESGLYEEVEADAQAMGQAMAVVVLSSLAAGIGLSGSSGAGGVLGIIGWYVWALLTWFIGTKLLPAPETEADVGQLLRTTGFSSAPGIARLLGVVPGLSVVVAPVTAGWMLAAMVVAVRQALDYTSTFRAVLVCLIGWVVNGLILLLAMRLTGGLGGVEG
jgi:hypothetical protein